MIYSSFFDICFDVIEKNELMFNNYTVLIIKFSFRRINKCKCIKYECANHIIPIIDTFF